MKPLAFAALALLVAGCRNAPPPAPAEAGTRELVDWLLEEGEELRSAPFAEVVEAASGRRVLPMEADSPADAALLEMLSAVLDGVLAEHNRDDSPVRGLRRINEASRFFEESISAAINALPDYRCGTPQNAGGAAQRTGYPDLMITHRSSGRITYLDPKLFEESGRDSSLRSFYYTPKRETGKVLHDARHLLVGVAHDGNDGDWQFTGWELVDLAGFRVRLKAEFQAANRDLYRDELILRRSVPRAP